MKEFNYTITDPEGIHARPAGELQKASKAFNCKITMTKGDKTADCKKIFAIMGMGIKNGQDVTFCFDGEDEDAAYDTVTEFIKTNL